MGVEGEEKNRSLAALGEGKEFYQVGVAGGSSKYRWDSSVFRIVVTVLKYLDSRESMKNDFVAASLGTSLAMAAEFFKGSMTGKLMQQSAAPFG